MGPRVKTGTHESKRETASEAFTRLLRQPKTENTVDAVKAVADGGGTRPRVMNTVKVGKEKDDK